MIRVEEEESFRKVVSENSFIDLDSETWEKDEVMAQNNDPKNGFVDVEKSKEEVEASKATNYEKTDVSDSGMSIARVQGIKTLSRGKLGNQDSNREESWQRVVVVVGVVEWWWNGRSGGGSDGGGVVEVVVVEWQSGGGGDVVGVVVGVVVVVVLVIKQALSELLPAGLPRQSQEPAKVNKKRTRPGQNGRPRPRGDRQLIQDRIKELRELVPNGSKWSIDLLLERTIKHIMLFMQSITKHADKLSIFLDLKLRNKGTSLGGLPGYDQGSSWAMEVGSHLKVCPMMAENINMNGQMLIEV
ncbi:hypothetical protein RHGRI_002858 [Rhododendron griersonianum]|uniref:BHLH domain-containing protein n=1 Tax=Rhododendron griersonianum TaxID=479676 RepID=A0AAV6LTK8_9ERIC|nr:hypothetical protein RHGRI_002858 [Rhododendron griersonianum]